MEKTVNRESASRLLKGLNPRESNLWEGAKSKAKTFVVLTTFAICAAVITSAQSQRGTYHPTEVYSQRQVPLELKESIKIIYVINQDTPRIEAIIDSAGQKNARNAITLNGRTDKNYWYQGCIDTSDGEVGLGYQAWDNQNKSIIPGFGGRKVSFDGPTSVEDSFKVTVTVDRDLVRIRGLDLRTNARAGVDLKAYGTVFRGGDDRANGKPTSIFREMLVNPAFDTAQISKEAVRLVYPRNLGNSKIYVTRDLYSSVSDTYVTQRAKPISHSDYELKSFRLNDRLLTYLVPNSRDNMLNNIRIGFSGYQFITEGINAANTYVHFSH